jgi:hypothetical protein
MMDKNKLFSKLAKAPKGKDWAANPVEILHIMMSHPHFVGQKGRGFSNVVGFWTWETDGMVWFVRAEYIMDKTDKMIDAAIKFLTEEGKIMDAIDIYLQMRTAGIDTETTTLNLEAIDSILKAYCIEQSRLRRSSETYNLTANGDFFENRRRNNEL